MSRKGENIFYRKDGRWEARYVKKELENGRYQYGYVYGKSYMEVKQKRNNILLNLEELKKQEIHSNYTFNYYIDHWLESIKFLVKNSTYCHYYSIVKNHIRPGLGYLELKNIKPEKIEYFMNQKFESGLSNKTIRDMAVVLKQIMSYAGVSFKFRLPKLQKKEIKILSKREQNLLEKEIFTRNDFIGFGILISLYTGLRIGEVCALQWKDINLDKKLLYVNHTMLRVMDDMDSGTRTKIILEEPKTEHSKREIPISNFLYKVLKNLKPLNKNTYFLTGTKDYIEPRTYYNNYKKILKDIGVKPYGFHSLRHTFATRCIEIGMDPKTLSEILGHSDVKVTLSLYVHPTNSLKSVYLDKLTAK